MKTSIRNVSRMLLFAGGITLTTVQANAQMKIGDNPATIKKSAILELDSKKQGLLLPRLTDFTAINTAIGADVVDGMIVYLASGNAANDGLYMRQGGAWVKIASAASALSNWSLQGNAGTTAADYIGTQDAQPLSIRTSGVEAIHVQASGDVQLKKVTDATADNAILDVLVIDGTGTIEKKTLPLSAFRPILADANVSHATFNISQDPSTGQATVNAPILDGTTSTAAYGFLLKSDWDRFNNFVIGGGMTVADVVTAAAAGDALKGAVITYNTTTSKYELQLIAASTTQNGIVTTDDQTFGGNKTFANNLTVTQAATVNNGLTVTAGGASIAGATSINGATSITGNTTVTGTADISGAATVGGVFTLNSVAAAPATGPYTLLLQGTANEVVKRTVDVDALETAVQTIKAGPAATNITSGTAIEFLSAATGTDFSIIADGTAKTVTFNLPDAKANDGTNPAQRGVVSTGDQSFEGKKSFTGDVAIGKLTTANSTLQVEGSVSMKIRKVNASGNVDETDNTILADATGGAITLQLPTLSASPATSQVGRIYTIKKIGTGDIDRPVTIRPAGAAQIEGGPEYVIYNDWTFVTLQTDGTNWYIIRK